MIRVPSYLVLVAMLVQAQFQPPSMPERKPAKPGSVTVTVINSVTQQPIPDVKISLFPSASTGETDGNGRAQINNLQPGTYSFSISGPTGFTVSLSRVPIIVKEGESVTVPPLALIPPGGIEGFVKDEDGNPVAGVDVEAMNFLRVWSAAANGLGLRPESFATTDENGHYRLTNLRPEPMIVRVSSREASGSRRFPRTYYPGVREAKQALRLHVVAGRDLERTDFRVRFAQSYHVRGIVALAAPPQGLPTLLIRPCDAAATGTGADIAEDGTFDFPDLIPGSYCVRYQELRLSDNKVVAYAATQVLVIDRDVERVQLVPEMPHTISGVIELDPGARMPMELGLIPTIAGGRGTAVAEIDESTRRFTMEGLLMGTYRLRAGFGPITGAYLKSARLGGRDIDLDSFIYAGEGGPLVLRIAQATGVLHGRVIGPSGISLSARSVVVAQAGSSAEVKHSSITNDRGEFMIQGVVPGSYKVYVWETEEYEWVRVGGFLDRFTGTAVTVKDGQQSEAETRLIPTTEIEKVKATF